MSEICFEILQKAKCVWGKRNKVNKMFINFEAELWYMGFFFFF